MTLDLVSMLFGAFGTAILTFALLGVTFNKDHPHLIWAVLVFIIVAILTISLMVYNLLCCGVLY